MCIAQVSKGVGKLFNWWQYNEQLYGVFHSMRKIYNWICRNVFLVAALKNLIRAHITPGHS